MDAQNVAPGQVQALVSSWPIPDEVKNFLFNLAWSETVSFQTYHFALANGQTSVNEVIATGRNLNGRVDVAYISATSRGTLRP
jgi:hypothetical protein